MIKVTSSLTVNASQNTVRYSIESSLDTSGSKFWLQPHISIEWTAGYFQNDVNTYCDTQVLFEKTKT